ncbi:MAG: class I SAM-dependent methyltransferase [Thaumarchaeota archaeon]|nr:class I SAM-dependent methyltransferase [Nitrososphaerota archaeon]
MRLASRLGNPVNERIIEYPWAIEHLKNQKDKRVLDVGCGMQGLLTSYLLSKGYDVYGLDIVRCRALPLQRFFLQDARNTDLPNSSFDTIILLSVLEHIGTDEEKDDIKTMQELRRILKEGGQILFTTPFAEEYSNRGQRLFSSEKLSNITGGFKILEERYFVQRGAKWAKTTLDQAREATHGYKGVHSIAIVAMVLQKS